MRKGSTDQPAQKDMFGISNYISGLCSFITDCETPMTIAIQGDWGSGKTSVMEMVKNAIDNEKVYCVWFNAWQFSQFNTDATLSLALIETIIGGLNISGGEQAEKMNKSIDTIYELGIGALKTAAVMATEITAGSTVAAGVKRVMNRNSESDTTVNKTIFVLKERFQKCINASVEKNKVNRILVFIDDLDRLQPIRAVELLEILKIFLDCEKCVFVLAIDYDVVFSGIKSKYGSDISAAKGRRFFDKIIQVPFKMPVAQYDIDNFVKTTFEGIAGIRCDEKNVKNYVALINSSIGNNPRSMKRLFNSYLLHLKVIGEEVLGKDDVSKKTLFAILCMQQSFESLYNYIVMNRYNRKDINAKFFVDLANDEYPQKILGDKTIEADDKEAEKIQIFMGYFNDILAAPDAESVDENDIDRLRDLLGSSSITATTETPAIETADTGKRKRNAFIYKGDKYQSRGGYKWSLYALGIRLILDYTSETDMSADEFMKLINSNIGYYASFWERRGFKAIMKQSDPLLKQLETEPGGIPRRYFTQPDNVATIGKEKLFIMNYWDVYSIMKLIGILRYEEKVSSNVGGRYNPDTHEFEWPDKTP